MKHRRNRRHLSLITEISVMPLLGLFLVMLLILLLASPLMNPAVGGGPVSQEPAPDEAPMKETLAVSQEKPPPPKTTPLVAIDAPTGFAAVFGETKFEITASNKVPPPSSPSDMAPADMTGVDQAIVAAFKQNWVLPAGLDVEGVPREADMDVVIARDGRIITYMLVKPSGHAQVDMSALRAAGLVKNIPIPLPAQFFGDSHEVQLHFRAE